MDGKEQQIIARFDNDPYKIVTEKLSDGKSDLKSFYFKRGANFYVFSYENKGVRRHTFIDAGDLLHRNRMLAILRKNNIEPGNIERIIITHSHRDHCGVVDLLAKESGAQILAHAHFKRFVESKVSGLERKVLGIFDPSCLRDHDITYLPLSEKNPSISLSGVNFPLLVDPIRIGNAGDISMFACPKSALTHTPDQLVVLYSPRSRTYAREHTHGDFRPTDDIIFAGDLWLMQGPLSPTGLRYVSRRLRFAYFGIKDFLSGLPVANRHNHREQDLEAKEALKRGFPLIRVKPGHGEEFLGTRIIPSGLLAASDILSLLGYADGDKSLLIEGGLAATVSDVQEKAYASFVNELLLWIDQGYTINELSDLLVRIYREQEGGTPLVAEDRRERRVRLKQTLTRLRDEAARADVIRQIAAVTLPKLL